MKNVIMCVKKDGVDGLIQIALTGHEEIKLFVEDSIEGVLKTASLLESIDLLILDDLQSRDINENTFSEVSNKILLTNKNINNWKCFGRQDWANACNHFLDELSNKLTQSPYATIPFYLLKKIENPIDDIFLQITKDGEPHYVKLFNKNEPLDQKKVEEYIDKGVVSAYISSDGKDQFLNMVSNSLYIKLSNSPTQEIVSESLDTAIILLKDIGFNSASTQLVEAVIDNINSDLSKKNTKSVDLIKNLLSSKASRYYKKAHLVALLGNRIQQMTSWATHGTQETFSYLSLFADITLEKPEMLFINSNELLEKSSFKDEEYQSIWTHAKDAYTLIQGFKERPIDVDLLILEHHGVKSGYGFSDVLTNDLQKMTLIYRIVEDFAVGLLKAIEMKEQIKIDAHFDALYKKHEKRSLHLIIDDLKKCFIAS